MAHYFKGRSPSMVAESNNGRTSAVSGPYSRNQSSIVNMEKFPENDPYSTSKSPILPVQSGYDNNAIFTPQYALDQYKTMDSQLMPGQYWLHTAVDPVTGAKVQFKSFDHPPRVIR